MLKGNPDRMEYLRKKRLVQIFYLSLLLFFVLAARLGIIQAIKGEYYKVNAVEQETSTVLLEDFPRGQILDRNLRPLAQSFWSNRVVVFPQAINKPEDIAKELASILKCDQNKLTGALKLPQVLPYKLSAQQTKAIRERNWPGVLVAPVHIRYGSAPLAAQVLGYLGQVNPTEANSSTAVGGWVGRTGLEFYYEQELRASLPQSYARLYTDAHGQWLKGAGIELNLKRLDPQRKNVITTIDADIQQIVEKIMDAHLKNGAVVVMDARNGDILALASRPKYNPDPKELGRYLEGEPGSFFNQGVSLFAPGSIFKVVVAAAALAEGVVTPDTIFVCRGEKDKPVRCWSEHGHGVLSFQQAFAQSCNPVFVRVALALGAEKLIHYARLFGLDNQRIAGYPLSFDSRQNLDLIAAPHNLVNSSLGQGPVLVTPVQITAMMNTIINDGKYLSPRLVKELKTGEGKVVRGIFAEPGRQVIPPEIARELQNMLLMVTTEGIGKEAFLTGYGSAGKTGSAQVGNSLVNAWFCGYAPLANPKYVVTVLVKNGISGSQTAAPLFKIIAEQVMGLENF